MNLYAYVANDPVNRADPSGRCVFMALCNFLRNFGRPSDQRTPPATPLNAPNPADPVTAQVGAGGGASAAHVKAEGAIGAFVTFEPGSLEGEDAGVYARGSLGGTTRSAPDAGAQIEIVVSDSNGGQGLAGPSTTVSGAAPDVADVGAINVSNSDSGNTAVGLQIGPDESSSSASVTRDTTVTCSLRDGCNR